MNASPSVQTYLAKSEAALAGAQLLLGSGDTDGACSRAYYAMFDAAHAALFSMGAEGISTPIKTHRTLVSEFGRRVVLTGLLAAEYGEALNRAQRFREIADYSGDPVSQQNAAWVVERAAALIEAVRGLIAPAP